jgi:branched-subunit amino acid aminotransferase/4-amino-4-deoxychorismate lyase
MFVAYRLSETKAYEMICTDAHGFVLEGASTNVFIVKKGQLWTPKTDMLPGLARYRVIELAREHELPLKVSNFKKYFLMTADEIFLTNCTREIIPVILLDGKKVGNGKPGPVTCRLMESYQDYITVYTSKNGSLQRK